MKEIRERQIETLAELRVAMDRTIRFSEENIPGGAGCISLKQARQAIGRACFYLGSPNPYRNANQMNVWIERSSDLSVEKVNGYGDHVLDTKSVIIEIDQYIQQIVDIRIKPLYALNPAYGHLLVRAFDRAIDHLEDAMAWYGSDIRAWMENNPKEYEEYIKEKHQQQVIPVDAITTDQIMQERAKQ